MFTSWEFYRDGLRLPSNRTQVTKHLLNLLYEGNRLFNAWAVIKVGGTNGPFLFFKVWEFGFVARKVKQIEKELINA